MNILDKNTVVVFDSLDLKTALEEDNGYNYIYFGDNISLENSIVICENKENIVIDGTYLDTKYTYTIDSNKNGYSILASSTNIKISVINMDVYSYNTLGIVYGNSSNHSNVTILYDNITFNGVQMGYNPYGKFVINNCNVTLQDMDNVNCEEAFEAKDIEISGNTSITSSSASFPLFFYDGNISSPTFTVLPFSRVSLRSENKEFLQGTYKLDFKILHDADVNLVTGNGFASYTIHGATNVLIDDRASFTFIENSHLRVPMWSIYGTLTVNEGANLCIFNTYTKTPSDNYNIHFKGSNCKIILNNPNSVVFYTPNANVLYTNNPLSFDFKIKRINLWENSTEFSMAGDINNIPDYSWYKENDLLELTGTLTNTDTTIEKHNLTDKELLNLPDLSNLIFQSRKQFSIGNEYMNIHPITNTSTKISGHTTPFADILVKYNSTEEIVNADDEGLFEYILSTSIQDNTEIEITSCVSSTFIYSTRKITIPHNGELSIMSAASNVSFVLSPITLAPILLPKSKEDVISIVDSRVNSSNWKLYARLQQTMVSKNGFNLPQALVFKNFNDELLELTTNPTLVFTGTSNGGDVLVHNVTWSIEKGLLLNLENAALEVNEEYFANIIWEITE